MLKHILRSLEREREIPRDGFMSVNKIHIIYFYMSSGAAAQVNLLLQRPGRSRNLVD